MAPKLPAFWNVSPPNGSRCPESQVTHFIDSFRDRSGEYTETFCIFAKPLGGFWMGSVISRLQQQYTWEDNAHRKLFLNIFVTSHCRRVRPP